MEERVIGEFIEKRVIGDFMEECVTSWSYVW